MASLVLMAGLASAQTEISFWHSMDGPAERVIAQFASAFNASQRNYRVTPRLIGDYREGETRLLAALRAGGAPVLFQAEILLFPRLVAEGVVLPLDELANTLPKSFTDDLFEAAWDYGLINNRRYGLPFNTSTPVLFFNENQLRARGLKVPTNWREFEQAAKGLTSRTSKGFIALSESWTFEAQVTSRGGNLVTADGRPNFTSREVVEALEFLQRLGREGSTSVRNLSESFFAQTDFIRTKGMMVMASIANWPAAENASFAFKLGVAPIPREPNGKVPLGGAQLVVLRGASEAQARGAVALWRYWMEPTVQAAWVQATYCLPLRRSAQPLLEDFYREDPRRRVVLGGLEQAAVWTQDPEVTLWYGFLEEALERVLKGSANPRQALEEAQRKALTVERR
jgi:sn-glycerol 3-phosphate transport system substrate-binding protein